MVFGQEVEVEWIKRERQGRIVSKVLSDGNDVCLTNHGRHCLALQVLSERAKCPGSYAIRKCKDEARAERLGCGATIIQCLRGSSGVGH